jgi:hypothetical protein
MTYAFTNSKGMVSIKIVVPLLLKKNYVRTRTYFKSVLKKLI